MVIFFRLCKSRKPARECVHFYGNKKQDSARIRLNEYIASADAGKEAGSIPTPTPRFAGGAQKNQPKPLSSDRFVEETS